jgi:site-specific DNA-methyltransferase (adenine-specific)
MKNVKLMLGDNMESLKKLPDNSVDSVVTDAPYGLGKEQDMNIVLNDWLEKGYSEIKGSGFMGKVWDSYVPQPIFWKEIYRILKPGGHVLSFFGTRTYDIGTMAIRLAGFEIRDQIMWLYGSGFPKSHNIGKAVDKLQGNEREVVGREELKERSTKKVEDASNVFMPREYNYTKGQSPYEGWGTALKPANEPICVARKPLSEKSVALNVLKWGTGGINIDGCRVGTTDTYNYKNGPQGNSFSVGKEPDGKRNEPVEMNSEGRFPANIILDEIAGELLDEQSGLVNQGHWPKGSTKGFGEFGGGTTSYQGVGPKDKTKSGASRFFYQAKVSKAERNMGLDEFEDKKKDFETTTRTNKETADKFGCERKGTTKNTHPTVKPVSLMAYLVRLVTPQGGIVLDPFMGSGSTGISAQLEGFRFVGMEMDEDYFKISEARINNYEQYRKFTKK